MTNMPTPSSWASSLPARSSACRPTPPQGALAPGLEATGNFRFVVHEAAGMIAVQLAVPVPEALLRLRARAFSTGRVISDVAADVVARRLRFEPSDED